MYGVAPMCALPWSADRRDMRVYFDMTMDLSAELTLKIYVTTAAGYAAGRADAHAGQPAVSRRAAELLVFALDHAGRHRPVHHRHRQSYDIATTTPSMTSCRSPTRSTAGRSTIRIGRPDGPMPRPIRWTRLTASGWNIDTEVRSRSTWRIIPTSWKVPLQPNTSAGPAAPMAAADLARHAQAAGLW